jgi:tetratricopeptide (TPR) repeat protein
MSTPPQNAPQQKSRRSKLEEFVAAHPSDAFARYGLAIECAGQNDIPAAVENFDKLLAASPDYVSGYFQYGQFLARIARLAEARDVFNRGIAAARRTGDQHAESEISAALASLPA